MKDSLGDRMKEQYEMRTKTWIPRRTWTVIRLDGKAFHSYTKGFKRPYDQDLMDLMEKTSVYLCQQIQGCKFAYTQSDEISLLLTDFAKPTTSAWFNGNVQKMVSISASLATGIFNHHVKELTIKYFAEENDSWEKFKNKIAFFDSRIFSIPDPVEVENYFIWRQKDATRNSINMLAQSLYSHSELQHKSIEQVHDMVYNYGYNWNDCSSREKRGNLIRKTTEEVSEAGLSGWVPDDHIPIFTQDREYLQKLIPKIGEEQEQE